MYSPVLKKVRLNSSVGLGRPQAQVVDGVVAVAGDGQVVGNAQHSFIIHPAGV